MNGANLGQEFIKRHKMDYLDIHIEELIDTYVDEMQRGLDGEDSSLLMLPSFVNTAGTVRRERPVVAVDAGGTNLRIALIEFDASGKCCFLSDIKRIKMPGVGEKIDAETFFDRLSGWLLPYMEKSM